MHYLNRTDKWDKWERYMMLQQDQRLMPHLPGLKWLKEVHLWEFVQRYGSVVVKPADSGEGRETVFIHPIGGDCFRFQTEMKKERIDRAHLYLRIAEEILEEYARYTEPKQFDAIFSRSYVIQQYIPAARIDHRPFDIRLVVQRKENKPWTVTGKLAKWADEGDLMTNARNGSIILPVPLAIERASLNVSADAVLPQLEQLSLYAAERLARDDPETRMIGLDCCIDSGGKWWIIAVNRNPSDALFLHLKDKTMYNVIQHYK